VNESGLADELTAEIVELDPEPNTVADEFSGDFRIISQVEDHDRFLVLWDTDQVERHRSSNNTYEFRLTLDGSSNLVAEDERLVEQRTKVLEPAVALTAEPSFTLAPWDDATMRVDGRTNLAPTTSLDVRALQETPNSYLWKNVVGRLDQRHVHSDLRLLGGDPADVVPAVGARVPGHERANCPTHHGERDGDLRVTTGGRRAVVAQNVTTSHGGFVRLRGQRDHRRLRVPPGRVPRIGSRPAEHHAGERDRGDGDSRRRCQP